MTPVRTDERHPAPGLRRSCSWKNRFDRTLVRGRERSHDVGAQAHPARYLPGRHLRRPAKQRHPMSPWAAALACQLMSCAHAVSRDPTASTEPRSLRVDRLSVNQIHAGNGRAFREPPPEAVDLFSIQIRAKSTKQPGVLNPDLTRTLDHDPLHNLTSHPALTHRPSLTAANCHHMGHPEKLVELPSTPIGE